jgi:hypothetical protein
MIYLAAAQARNMVLQNINPANGGYAQYAVNGNGSSNCSGGRIVGFPGFNPSPMFAGEFA